MYYNSQVYKLHSLDVADVLEFLLFCSCTNFWSCLIPKTQLIIKWQHHMHTCPTQAQQDNNNIIDSVQLIYKQGSYTVQHVSNKCPANVQQVSLCVPYVVLMVALGFLMCSLYVAYCWPYKDLIRVPYVYTMVTLWLPYGYLMFTLYQPYVYLVLTSWPSYICSVCAFMRTSCLPYVCL